MAKKSRARNPYEYFSVAADILILRPGPLTAKGRSGWELLLIERKNPPYKGSWALPGGFVDRDEDALTAAHRELFEEVGLELPKLHEYGSFSAPGRDPRGRTLSVAYFGKLTSRRNVAKAGDDAKNLAWFPVTRLPPLAFDHKELIAKGLAAFRKTLP